MWWPDGRSIEAHVPRARPPAAHAGSSPAERRWRRRDEHLHALIANISTRRPRWTSASSSKAAVNPAARSRFRPSVASPSTHRVPGIPPTAASPSSWRAGARSRPNWSWSDRFTAGPGGRPARLPSGPTSRRRCARPGNLVLFRNSGVTQLEMFRPRPGGPTPTLSVSATSGVVSAQIDAATGRLGSPPAPLPPACRGLRWRRVPGEADDVRMFDVTVSPGPACIQFGPDDRIGSRCSPPRRMSTATAIPSWSAPSTTAPQSRPLNLRGIGARPDRDRFADLRPPPESSRRHQRRRPHGSPDVDVAADDRSRQPRPAAARPAGRHLRRGSELRGARHPGLWATAS